MLRFFEIAEGEREFMNPISREQIDDLSAMMRLQPGQNVLDIGCGQGGVLTHLAWRYQIRGTGVDFSQAFLRRAQERAKRRGVADQLRWVHGDGADYLHEGLAFDHVVGMGMSWIGGGTRGMLNMLRQALNGQPHNRILYGDIFWKQELSETALAALGLQREHYPQGVAELNDWLREDGFEMVAFTEASLENWDGYYSVWWSNVAEHLQQHPDDPEAEALRDWIDGERQNYLRYERGWLGWALMVLAPR